MRGRQQVESRGLRLAVKEKHTHIRCVLKGFNRRTCTLAP